jgi:hypothetical protein
MIFAIGLPGGSIPSAPGLRRYSFLDAVRREAKKRGLGYQSLINDLLAKHADESGAPRTRPNGIVHVAGALQRSRNRVATTVL